MRTISAFSVAAIASCAAALLAGCSGSGSSGALSPLASAGQMRSNAGASVGQTRSNAGASAAMQAATAALKELAVSDLGGGSILSRIELLNKNYAFVGTITDGIDGATGDWFDGSGNLYVGNYAVPMVREYAKGSSSPTFTYSSGQQRPYSVVTDASGNVYVADQYNPSGSGGGVLEYAQGSNTIMTQCLSGLNYAGVAVSRRGDVFLSATNGTLVEYKRGLSGCKPKTLGVSLSSAAGLLIDNMGNLVVCAGHAVDVIPPPYTSVSLTITGFEFAAHDALNKTENLLFVADPENYNVQVFTYPAGTYVTMLDRSNGLIDPIGVAVLPAPR